MRRRTSVALLAVLTLGGPAAAQITRLDDVHVDVAISYNAGTWTPSFREELDQGGYTFHSLPTTYAVANPSTRVVAPAAVPMLGVTAGQDIYVLRSTFTTGQLYLGVANAAGSGPAMGPPPAGSYANWNPGVGGVAAGTWIELQVRAVTGTGPADGGQFAVWKGSLANPTVYASTALGGGPDSVLIPMQGHDHYNWGFSRPGVYEVAVNARTFYDAGAGLQELHSNPTDIVANRFVYQFEVQPVPEPASCLAAAVAVAGGVAGVRRVRRR
jgi:surface-anchored protein